MRVIVIGGGAVGLCAAESLSARDCEVTVMEAGRCGAGASAGNAGWITPSLATPVPGPGVIAQSLRWLVNPSGPLWIRPTVDPALLDWVARFVANCRRSVYLRGLMALQRAAARAGPAFDALAARGVEFEHHEEPLLFPAFEPAELDQVWRLLDELGPAGSRQRLERVTPEELRRVEPALADDVIGGIVAHDERRIRPEVFTAGVHRALTARGVQVLEGAPVTRLVSYDREWQVETPSGSQNADAVVIAAGVDSSRLLASHGVRLPLAAAKGYSRTYPRHPTGPQQPLYLEGPKVAISVFDDGVRVSGTLELGARSLVLSRRRLAAIAAAAQRALPGWQVPSQRRDWAGMRSLSPDGLPYIGPVPGLGGVHLATGHATLGMTLAPLTGELLEAMLLGGARDEFDERFRSSPRNTRRPEMRGVYAAIVTHFDADLAVDHDAVAGEVNRLIGAGIHGILPNGTVGEGGSLSREERREVIETTVSAAAGQVPVCAGVSAATAEQAAIYARDARSAGAESVMSLPPLLYRADRRELIEFFTAVARAAELPLMIYNNPMSSGSDLEPELLADLVREVPGIVALKETSGDARRIAHLVNLCPEVGVMVGGDDWALEGFCAGAVGWVSGVADVFPAESVRLWDLCQGGELAAARSLYADLLPLSRLDMTPKLVQYFKAALDEIGIGGGPCRPPRLPLTDEELAVLREAVAQGALAGTR